MMPALAKRRARASSLAFGIGILAFGVVPHVSAAGWTDNLDSVRTTSLDIRTLEAEFVQSRSLAILSRPIVSRGRLAYRRPGDLRWEYTTPLASVLIVHGGTAARYLRRDGKLVADATERTDALAAVLGEINLWLSGDFGASKMFRPALKHDGKKAKVELVPIEPSVRAILQSVVLKLGDKPGTVEAIVIDEGQDGTTHIDFSKLRVNEALAADAFAPR